MRPSRTTGRVRPCDFPGLALWLDAAAAETLFTDTARIALAGVGDSVAAWGDRSGQGYHATQIASNQRPTRQAGSLRFDGADDALRCDALASRMAGTDHPLSLFLVFRQANTATDMRPFTLASDSSTSPLHTVQCLPSGGAVAIVRRDSGSVSKTLSCGATTTGVRVLTHVFAGLTSLEALDGTTVVGDLSLGANPLTVAGLGARRLAGAYDRFLAGDLMEVVVFDRAVCSWERAMLERSLRAKWSAS